MGVKNFIVQVTETLGLNEMKKVRKKETIKSR